MSGREAKEFSRIRDEAEQVCVQYGIKVTNIDILPKEAGGGYAVNISLPPGYTIQSPEVEEIRTRIESITGVTSVFVVLASQAEAGE